MKHKLTENLIIRIASVVLAFLIWLIIVNTYDPLKTETYRNIPVEMLNEDAILSLDQVYEVVEGTTVDVVVKGKRSIVNTISASDIKATADLSNISPTYNATIEVECAKAPSVDLSLGNVSMVKVALENRETAQLKVTAVTKGVVADGYHVGSLKVKPNLIQVSGGESSIKKIAQICVEIDVSNATENFKVMSEPRAYDQYGDLITTGSLVFSSTELLVTAEILQTKEVPIRIVTVGEPYTGYRMTTAEYDPQNVTIAGATSVLNAITEIPIEIDITNRITGVEETLKLAEYLPKDTILTSGGDVVLQLSIVRLHSTDFNLPIESVVMRNLPDGFSYHFDEAEGVTVRIMGLEEDLKNLELEDLNPYIDALDMEEGVHETQISFDLDEKFAVVLKPTVEVTLMQLPPEADELPEVSVDMPQTDENQ